MKVGFIFPQTELAGRADAVRELARAGEEFGYDHILAYDHVVGAQRDREPKLTGPYDQTHPFHDPLMMFSHIAAFTSRIKFITGVLILPQRQTVLVARQVADLDLLSGGRFVLGVGVGWNYVEYDALRESFETRGLRVDDQIQLLRRLWSEPVLSYDTPFDHMDRGCINPRPDRLIPIWIGGKVGIAFRRAGRLGDGFVFSGSPETCTRQWSEVRHHLASNGRGDQAFDAALMMTSAMSSSEVAETAIGWAQVGGTHASVLTMGLGLKDASDHIAHLAEVRDRLPREYLNI